MGGNKPPYWIQSLRAGAKRSFSVANRNQCAFRWLACVGALALSALCRGQLVADGLFDDWSPSVAMVSDPAGDATGTIDLIRACADSNGTDLFLRIDVGMQQPIQVYRSTGGMLVITVEMPSGTLELRTTTRTAYLNGIAVGWNALGVIGPSHDAREYEMQIHLGLAGAVAGQTVRVSFGGSDSIGESLQVTLSKPATEPVRRSATRAPATEFRLAALNVENSGLFQTAQSEPLARLLRAVRADVYCLSELRKVTGIFNATETELAAKLTSIDPLGDRASWNALMCPFPRNGTYADTAICTTSEIVPAPAINAQCTAGVVLLPSGPVLVICLHPKCCNNVGTEDAKRLQTAQEVAGAIDKLRTRAWHASMDAYADAPVVLAGDWNLVGSPQPLQVLTESASEPMHDCMPRHLIGSAVTTWGHRATTYLSEFMPSRIDLIVHSTRLDALNGFVLDPADCNQNELSELGLAATDGFASDHLAVVVDFAGTHRRTADLDGSGQVDFADVALIMLDFGPCPGCASDLDANGQVDFSDIAIALLDFGPAG